MSVEHSTKMRHSTSRTPNPRDGRIMLAVSDHELNLLKEAAKRSDLPLATFTREVAVSAANTICKMPAEVPCPHGTEPGRFCFRCGKRI